MFCKQLLGVRKNINTEGVLQELGMTPLILCAIKSAVKNWERIQKNNANSLLISSNSNAHQENLPWASNIRQIFHTNGMLHEYLQKLNETEDIKYGPITGKLHKRMNDQFNQMCFGVIHSSSKMKMLNLLKNLPGKEKYLTHVTNSKHRIAMTKLRLSGHRLEIERGRYKKKKKNQSLPVNTDAESRFCSYCQLKGQTAVEDEIHFLIKCPMSQGIRENSFPPQNLQDTQLTDEEKFVLLMSDNETNDLRKTAKFIYCAFEEREIQLDVLNTLKDLVTSTEKLLSKPDPGIKHQTCRNKSKEKFPIYEVKNVSQNGLKIILSRQTQNPLLA